LRRRGTESEAAVQRRLEVARRELQFIDRYAYVVTNESIEEAVQEIVEILQGFKECAHD
jgi:guanylate kinase